MTVLQGICSKARRIYFVSEQLLFSDYTNYVSSVVKPGGHLSRKREQSLILNTPNVIHIGTCVTLIVESLFTHEITCMNSCIYLGRSHPPLHSLINFTADRQRNPALTYTSSF